MRAYGLYIPQKAVRIVDRIVLGTAILAPIVTIPQIFQLYTTKSSANLSLLSWCLYILCAVPWVAYGIFHRDRRIILSTSLWLFFDIWMVILIIVYK
jgi:uncharacterized protein with PQ loop repeat